MLAITAEQRDALYDEILSRMAAIDDVWMAASKGDYASADRLGREYCDELRLLLDDLGWGATTSDEPIRLTTPPHVLRRLLARLEEGAIAERARRSLEWEEHRRLEERNRLVGGVCRDVLRCLGQGQG